MTIDLDKLSVRPDATLHSAMEQVNQSGRGIVLLLDHRDRFLATITDGDIRRAILAGSSIDSPITDALGGSDGTLRHSITAHVTTPRAEQLAMMRKAEIRHLPLLDDDRYVVDLALSEELGTAPPLAVQAVIMAGGFGTRLRPLTDDTPKPMLPIAGRPLMERTIEGLQRAGVHRINVTTHYMPEKITEHFGSGHEFGVELNYVSEDQPLGTAGALGLLGEIDEPLLVINGDILTNTDFGSLVRFHHQQNALLTVGVRHYDLQVPYGVVEAENGRVIGLREKPTYDFFVNAGVYLLDPSVRQYIPRERRYDMTDLIELLLSMEKPVASYPILEYWIDIGKHDDFDRAQREVGQLRKSA